MTKSKANLASELLGEVPLTVVGGGRELPFAPLVIDCAYLIQKSSHFSNISQPVHNRIVGRCRGISISRRSRWLTCIIMVRGS